MSTLYDKNRSKILFVKNCVTFLWTIFNTELTHLRIDFEVTVSRNSWRVRSSAGSLSKS